MGRAVPRAGAGEAVVWVYLAQVHTTYLETNSHFLSWRLLWVNKQDCCALRSGKAKISPPHSSRLPLILLHSGQGTEVIDTPRKPRPEVCWAQRGIE